MWTIKTYKEANFLTIKNGRVNFFQLAIGVLCALIFIGTIYLIIDLFANGFKSRILNLIVLIYVLYIFYGMGFEYLWRGLGDDVIEIKSNKIVLYKSIFGLLGAKKIIKIDELERVRVVKFEPNTAHGLENFINSILPNSDYILEFQLKNMESYGLWKNIWSEHQGREIIKSIETSCAHKQL
jgi:hypothetical protein